MGSVRNIIHKRKKLAIEAMRSKSIISKISLFIFRLKIICRNVVTAIRLGWHRTDIIYRYNRLNSEKASVHRENMRVHELNSQLQESLKVEVETNLELSMNICKMEKAMIKLHKVASKRRSEIAAINKEIKVN